MTLDEAHDEVLKMYRQFVQEVPQSYAPELTRTAVLLATGFNPPLPSAEVQDS
jgi:hypothetical protein